MEYRQPRRIRGFTLIEMMVSVAIIGVLASTSVALFQNYQNRSRMTEAKSNLASIRDVQKAFFAEASTYGRSFSCPALFPAPTGNPQNWKQARSTFCDPALSPPPNLDSLGWQPEGATYFDYDVATGEDGAGPRFTAAAYGDVDGDGNLSIVMYVEPDTAGNAEPCVLCGGLGVPALPWDPVTCQTLTNQLVQMPRTQDCGQTTVPDNF